MPLYDPKRFNDWITLGASLLAIIAGIWLFGKRVWHWLVSWTHAISDARRLREIYGDAPIDYLNQLVQEHGYAISSNDIRSGIVCRKLKIGIYLCDQSGACYYASEMLGEIFGLEVADMLGSGWLAAIEGREEAAHIWEFAFKRRIRYQDLYAVRNRRNGELYRCRTEAYPVHDDSLYYVGWVEILETVKPKETTQ